MDMQQAIHTLQDSFNDLGQNFENLIKSLVALKNYEALQAKTIAEKKDVVRAQCQTISKLKDENDAKIKLLSCSAKPPEVIQIKEIENIGKNQNEYIEKIKDKNQETLSGSINKSINTTKNKDVLKKNYNNKESSEEKQEKPQNLKRKVIQQENTTKRLKKQKKLDSFFPNLEKLLPKNENSDKKTIENINPLSETKKTSQVSLTKMIIDSEGFIVKPNKTPLQDEKPNSSKVLSKNSQTKLYFNKPEINDCTQCKTLYNNLADIVNPGEMNLLCSEHTNTLQSVPNWYFETIK